MPWAKHARCAGDDATFQFFGPPSERPERARVREQFAIATYCDVCPVRTECRTYAREHREYGVWGGETEMERAAAGYGPNLAVGMVDRANRVARIYGKED